MEIYPLFSTIRLSKHFICNRITDCLKDILKDEIKESNITCTLPWIQDMLGEKKFNSIDLPECDANLSFWKLRDLGNHFARKAAKYKYAKCAGSNTTI